MNFLWSLGSPKKTEPIPNGLLPTTPSQQSFRPMNNAFRKGVQYNMKVVLRGDVMTGKSLLFNRLQGEEYEDTYQSTPQIQVANIPWQYKDSNDIVKIEIWDVVDKAHNNSSKKGDGAIKLQHGAVPEDTSAALSTTESTELALDASTVDVYRNAQAALFLFDVTKPWTFDYVNQELANVPSNMTVLVLGNFCDKSQERKISTEAIHATLYEHNKQRIDDGAIKPNLIRYAETSLKSGMGLKYIYEYFGVPFLQLMMDTLRKQLEIKSHEIIELLVGLDSQEDVPDSMRRRRGQDNFDQPAEPHLARQREELKETWENELEELEKHQSPLLDIAHQEFIRQDTPSPPIAPVKIQKRQGSLVPPETPPPVVDHLDSGSLEDDWFGDDGGKDDSFKLPTLKASTADSDNEYGGNPMVTGDEDVESVEYFNDTQSHPRVERLASLQIASDDEKETEEQTVTPAIYRSELDDVWTMSNNANDQVATTEIISESDEDEISPRIKESFGTSFEGLRVDSPFGFGVYEEIGEAGGNPWSLDKNNTQDEQTYESKNVSFDCILGVMD
ncbi:P-loop containing nucleoside triphosphate hydrolase protein [Phycomyces nitens]|nr:P-loop containing nucleoside triphosphate hydrolase protein [Phycomyces nitens]